MSANSTGYAPSDLVARFKHACTIDPGRIALPEFLDERMIRAARHLLMEKSFAQVHTLTTKTEAFATARQYGIDLAAVSDRLVCLDDLPSKTFIDPSETSLQHAGRLLHANLVDSVLAGAVHTTADVIRAAISTVGLSPGGKTVSGSFLMHRSSPGNAVQNFIFADCGVVIEPTLPQLRDIARASVLTWRQLMGAEAKPVVAFLSFSTKGSAKHPHAEQMATAAAAFQAEFPDIECEGELQFDAAIDPAIGIRKCPDSKAAGRANIFIFPDLGSGNIAYKITERLAGFAAYGPILQGCAKVFSDLSRGATTEDIIACAYINQIRSKSR